MPQELSYVIITPYSLHKSRTGGIISRLIARTGVELVAARMFAPSQELVNEYADQIISADDPQDRKIQEMLRDYILQNFAPDPKTGRRRRVMMLLFQGEDAVRRTRSVVGHISLNRRSGETIRDTYGDLIVGDDGQVRYFEPAVLAAPTREEAESKLKVWAKYSDTDGGVLENVIAYQPGETGQRTLVLIKPENFRFPTGRPGNMIDFFSRTGLFIVGVKLHRMSVAQAIEFYGPVREVLRTKLKDMVAARAKAAIEREMGFKIGPEEERQLGAVLSPAFGDNQFENIVRFMSGRAPSECPPDEMNKPGSEKCIALVYEGVDAVRKIRDVLGPTDPSKAPPGSIRREFGQSVMINAAHASDSPENAEREMKIVQVGENLFRQVIEQVYG
ncbi:MAG TPA: nucleoside-diphosphate kinase [Verrucomicrobiota bacterium]|jgi:nucleoside diphosphate kinase|nr:nucleoside-diphosphate kinase [Verrucomicrobiota bacterium]HRT07389.1 nucleoside-diphosphate kinase [Candidatus Paceibacterota bacterium]HRT55554.1 nucleoside-diphosphate kinase [Candidatus Paceibacterota bacterium]